MNWLYMYMVYIWHIWKSPSRCFSTSFFQRGNVACCPGRMMSFLCAVAHCGCCPCEPCQGKYKLLTLITVGNLIHSAWTLSRRASFKSHTNVLTNDLSRKHLCKWGSHIAKVLWRTVHRRLLSVNPACIHYACLLCIQCATSTMGNEGWKGIFVCMCLVGGEFEQCPNWPLFDISKGGVHISQHIHRIKTELCWRRDVISFILGHIVYCKTVYPNYVYCLYKCHSKWLSTSTWLYVTLGSS